MTLITPKETAKQERKPQSKDTTRSHAFESTPQEEPLVQIRNLKKHFSIGDKVLKAVDGISLDLKKGETLGLVGESGCGKSTVGRTLLRLHPATEGEFNFAGEELLQLSNKKFLPYRRKIQMIFQDPYASLNPRMMISEIVGEALDIHRLASGARRKERVAELLESVGLKAEHMSRFPHEFSGGQRQRVGIARAMAVEPEFVVCDEPISALDVSIQAQVVNLLKKLQKEKGLTYLFIAHDLSMVEYISDRIAVMYLGRLMELAPASELYRAPVHPYTQALLSAIPQPDPEAERKRTQIALQGEVPSPIDPPKGCVFCQRCPRATAECRENVPHWREVRANHFVACHNISV